MTPKTSSTPISQERAILMSLPDEDIRKLLDYGRALSQARMTVSKNSPYKQLMDAIGLDNLKETVKAIISSHKMSFLLKAKGRPYLPPHNHLSFVGNPGTFKTGAGKLFADIMFEEGVLPTNRFIYKTRSLLVGMYMGETALLVKKAIDEAEGGVLFIDEAYSLVEDNSRKAYGDEAINEFVSRMDSLQNTIIIFAGYKKEMKEFFEKNPGLASRIQKVVTFDDYSTEELAEISKRMAKDRGFDISEDAINTKLIPIFKEAKSCASTTFGNGRFCRNLVEDAIARKANNINFETVFRESDEELFTLEANCFKMPELLLKTEKTSKIGF